MNLATRIEKAERRVAELVLSPRRRPAFFVLTHLRVRLGVISRDQIDGMLHVTDLDTDAGTFAYIAMVLCSLFDDEAAYNEWKARYLKRVNPPLPWPIRTGRGYIDGHHIDAAIIAARARIASNQEDTKR